ncbi:MULTISPECIES: type VI secretion lipoprotein TssJ [unclassified Paraburkholderia]|uniref:type VI secretion lipoprotein TssJ n=1 Tax=unclassified Paraburkholderia TaxID=2615204 RepID=UPI002AB5FF53|nr:MULTISPECIES: type VI secretion lipoprotein TssJ [unclassified Paraburkholderia]
MAESVKKSRAAKRLEACARVARPLAGLASIAGVLALAACGSTPPKDPLADVNWSYAADSIILEISADPALNQYDGQSHTLLLGIYESGDAQAFRNLTAEPSSLADTMASGKVPQAFSQFSRYVVSPGQHSWLILDRAQNTRAIGVAAGYAQFGVANAARQFDVPVVTKTSGFIFRTHSQLPGPLVVRLNLGTQGILNAEVQSDGPDPAAFQHAQPLEGGGKQIRLSGAAPANPDATGATTGILGAASAQDMSFRKLAN